MSIIITKATELIRAYNLHNVSVPQVKDNPFDGKIDQTTYRDKELYKSSLGTPVIADLTFKGGSYINQEGKLVTFQEVKLITVLVNVSRAKKIITTDIQGLDGTVKEYIGQGDFDVTVNGIVTGDNGRYPFDEVRVIEELVDAPIAIEVVSRYLQNINIFNLVVTNHAFDQEAGGYSKQNFTINCISDKPIILKIL